MQGDTYLLVPTMVKHGEGAMKCHEALHLHIHNEKKTWSNKTTMQRDVYLSMPTTAKCDNVATTYHTRIYENSNISPCKNIIFWKSSKRNQNPFKILL